MDDSGTSSYVTALRSVSGEQASLLKTPEEPTPTSVADNPPNGVAPVPHNGRVPHRFLQFVGFVEVLPGCHLWRVYTSPGLDEGVEFPAADKRYRASLDKSPVDGLVREVVTVADDADVIYWSRKPPRANREPGGGNGSGYPFA